MPNIEFLSFREDPIKATAKYLLSLKEKGTPLEKVALIFGGRRPGMFLNRELFRLHGKPLLSPVFFTMDEFASYIACRQDPCSQIGDLDADYFIYKLCRDKYPGLLREDKSFASFLPWAREIRIFIEQLDLQNIAKEKLKAVEASAAIGYAVPEPVNKLLENINGVKNDFEKYCFKERKLTHGLMYREAARSAGGILKDFEFFVFSGFFYFYETELAIVKTIMDSGKAKMLFQGDPKEWPVLEMNAKHFGVKAESPKNNETTPNISLYCGQDSHAEAALVRQVLEKIEDPENTLLVVADPAKLPVLLSAVSPLPADFNISLGYPLKRTIVFPLFDGIFRAQENKKGGLYYSRDYLKIMTNPVIKNLALNVGSTAIRITIHKIAEALLGTVASPVAGKLFISLEEIINDQEIFEQAEDLSGQPKDKLREEIKLLHKMLFQDWQDINTLAALAAKAGELVLTVNKFSQFSSYPFNVKAIEETLNLAETVSAASCSKEVFEQEDIFRIFRQFLESGQVSFKGSPLKGLQILGMLETRSLSFKEVLVTDLNEGTVPQIRQMEPLIPREIMITLGINRLEKEEEIQRYVFRRLIGGAEKVHLFYQEAGQNERSRFLEQLLWEKQKKEMNLQVFSPQKGVFRIEPALKQEKTAKTGAMISYLREFTYSPSSLDTYLNCPRQFYYKYVLNLQEKTDLLSTPEPREIGTFIHELLHQTFTEFLNKRPVIDAGFEAKFFRAFKKKFEEDFHPRLGDGAFLLESVLKHRLERFLRNEKERPVAQLIVLENKYPYKIGDFKLSAKVDRVDELNDGTLLVVDYKTGGKVELPSKLQKLREMALDRPGMKKTIKTFQMPIYISIFRDSQQGREVNACLYNLRETRLSMCFKKEDPAERTEALELIMAAGQHLLKEIIDPAKPFEADLSDTWQCEYCAFQYLCR
jgi:ATP-dependent helicase/nuclease subunit B